MRFFEGNLGQNLSGDFLTVDKKKLFFYFFCYSRGLRKNYYNSNNWCILTLTFVPSKIFLDNLHSAFEDHHCVKSIRIRSCSGLHFPTFRLNTERYGVSFPIQSKCGKMQTRITPNMDTFYAVPIFHYAETIQLICSTNQMIRFYIELHILKRFLRNRSLLFLMPYLVCYYF